MSRAQRRKNRRQTATVILLDALMHGPLTNMDAVRLLSDNRVHNTPQYPATILKPFVKTGEVIAGLDARGRRYWELNRPDDVEE